MNTKKGLYKKGIILILFSLLLLRGNAQELKYEVTSETTIYLKAVYNNDKNHSIAVIIDDHNFGIIAAGSSLPINKTCRKYVKITNSSEKKVLWKTGDTSEEWKKKNPNDFNEEIKETSPENSVKESEKEKKKEEEDNTPITEKKRDIPTKSQVISAFKDELEKDSFYSASFVQKLNDEINRLVEPMSYIKDEESRDKYRQEHHIDEYINEKDSLISEMEAGIESYVRDFLKHNFKKYKLSDQDDYEKELRDILVDKITERKDVLYKLRNDTNEDDLSTVAKKLFSGTSIAINIIVGILFICLVILIVMIIRRRNSNKKKPTIIPDGNIRQNAKSDIVVRRKTTSILKKQSLEDVHHNNAYLQIDCSEFCTDSAVRRIYFKNTCIKDIYNLYAEDLRNPENPNEDGCMVLGRWVHDDENDEYYVSLEEIVKPGDDAVFKEYELNFGGKIKLKVSEKLRRLRRETNLQYDMTCWVHSHPGLGVFFSNADSSVQMQLKHPTHPKFLVAIVIDILTPEQELGIFTFKHDLTINSKADLTKMYSLEELHKWAVDSDRTSFKSEDYNNIMQTAKKRLDSHSGIELSNGAIIDMCQLQTEQETGLLAWVHGYTCENNGRTEYIVTSVSKSKRVPDNDLIGCFINGSHCSIPTIRRIIANEYRDIKFILFYSTANDALTSIPVVNNQVSVEEIYYGEEKLENLKIWTRRKR